MSTPDAAIAELHEMLLDRLESKLRSEAPTAVRWFKQLGQGRSEYFRAHPNVWPRILGSFDASERDILSGLFDIRLGLDSVRFQSEQALAAVGFRAFHMATMPIPVAISALLERLEFVGKRAHRSEIVDASVERAIGRAVAKYRERDPFLTARDATAHGSFVDTKSWLSAPKADRLWEAVALQSEDREPLDSLYRGTVSPQHHVQTQTRLTNIESVTGYSLSLLLEALRQSP